MSAIRYPDCQSCGKKLTGKQVDYCSEKCCQRESNRRRRVVEAQGLKIKLCEVCGKEMNGPANKKYHTGECAYIAHTKRVKRYKRAMTCALPYRTGKCVICGNEFTTRHPKQVTCRDESCKNKHQRNKAKVKWDALPQEEKKIIGKKKYRKNIEFYKQKLAIEYNTPVQTVKAKCPGCGCLHDVDFEIAYLDCVMPRIKCDKWPSCIKHLDNSDYAILPSQAGWQSDNNAYI